MAKFEGKYRAFVRDIADPEQRGRVRVLCPMVWGSRELSPWCDINLPFDVSVVPTLGSSVWVEFQQGDISKPVVTGAWLAGGTAPTDGSYTISVGGATVKLAGGKVYVNDVDIIDKLDKHEKDIEMLKSRL